MTPEQARTLIDTLTTERTQLAERLATLDRVVLDIHQLAGLQPAPADAPSSNGTFPPADFDLLTQMDKARAYLAYVKHPQTLAQIHEGLAAVGADIPPASLSTAMHTGKKAHLIEQVDKIARPNTDGKRGGSSIVLWGLAGWRKAYKTGQRVTQD